MQRWEYMVVRMGNVDPYINGLPVDGLNEMGEDGWELIGMLPLKHSKKRFFPNNAVEKDDVRIDSGEIKDALFVPDYLSTVELVWKRPKQ